MHQHKPPGISAAHEAKESGTVVLCADSAYDGRAVVAGARRHEARFSITAGKNRAITGPHVPTGTGLVGCTAPLITTDPAGEAHAPGSQA